MFSSTLSYHVFHSVYLLAIGLGVHKPCVQALGADVFDADNPEDAKPYLVFQLVVFCIVCWAHNRNRSSVIFKTTLVGVLVLGFLALSWVLLLLYTCLEPRLTGLEKKQRRKVPWSGHC